MRGAGQAGAGIPPSRRAHRRRRPQLPSARRLPLTAETPSPVEDDAFLTAIAACGPWPPDRPAHPVALGVSGGADSLCLALLASRWRRALFGVVVDHGLRPESAEEAAFARSVLTELGIPSRTITLSELRAGPGVQERARALRLKALQAAAAEAGCVDLLLGHHAADQRETLWMRDRGQGARGMSPVVARAQVRVVRPLLSMEPGALRARLRREGIAWRDDPSNRDLRYGRARARAALATETPPCALPPEDDVAREAASCVIPQPGGAAFVRGTPSSTLLRALVRSVACAEHPPSRAVAHAWRESPRPATLGGVRILAGEGGWWLVREEGTMAASIPASDGAIWDGRVVVRGSASGLEVGALGDSWHDLGLRRPRWPAALLRVIPAFLRAGRPVFVPAFGWRVPGGGVGLELSPAPERPAFVATRTGISR